MLNVLQSIFIIVLKPVSRLSSKLNEKTRAICIQLTCIYFPFYFIYYYMGINNKELLLSCFGTHNERHLMGCLFLLLLIFFSLDRAPRKVKWSVWIMYPMIICGIWMMIISFIHPVGDGYRAFAMMLIVAYPCLFFVWNNRGDYDNLFTPLSHALALTGGIYFVFCLYLASRGELRMILDRCAGLLYDANQFSMVGMVSCCGSLYLLVKYRKSWLRFFTYSITLGMGIAIVVMGQSRISLAVCAVNILVALFFYFRYCSKSRVLVIIIKIIIVAGIIANMIILSSLCIEYQKNLLMQLNGWTETSQEATADSVESQQENVPAEESSDSNSTQSGNTSVIDRIKYDENTTLDTYTAGRYHIWQNYMQFMNLTGNDYSKVDWNILTENTVHHAHNNFVEMAYRFGVPLGILFILFEAIVCFKALQYLFLNRKKQFVVLLPIFFVVMFLFESMLDIGTLPFERDAPFYYYMALIPMVDMGFRFKDKLP